VYASPCVYSRDLCLGLVILPALLAQAQRDPQAVAIATQAFKVLGGSLPADSRAIGNYDRVVGSFEDTGTIEVLTRGSDQTSEKITNVSGTVQTIYSRGYAAQRDQNGIVTSFGLEKSLASNSVVFPLAVIAPAVLEPNSTVQFVATESLNGKAANHIRIGPSTPDQNFTGIISLGTKNVWVDTASGLPLQITYQVLDAEGEVPVSATALYSSYQQVGGAIYPFQIQESKNGTPYMAISITSVAFNGGLTDQNFPLH
jgi:hypothetical protein